MVNQGIGGNLVVNDSAWYGEKSTNRFRRDVLEQAGVRTVIILEGVNDIGFSESDTPTYKPAADVSVAELIAGYRQLIRDAHSRGVRVIGATLPAAGRLGSLQCQGRGQAGRAEQLDPALRRVRRRGRTSTGPWPTRRTRSGSTRATTAAITYIRTTRATN